MPEQPTTTPSLCDAMSVDRHDLALTVRQLAARRETVALAESLTAGLLAATITEIPGASAVLVGGFVCYATATKSAMLGVDAELLARLGPVDAEVARQLAVGARRRIGATWGIGLTGVAGPGAQGGHQPGTVFVALTDGHHDVTRALTADRHGARPERNSVRAAAVRCALGLLASHVRPGGDEG